VSFEFKKFSHEFPKGEKDKDFQLYGLKIPGRYMRSTVILFHATQLQSISPLHSGVVTEEQWVQSCSTATQPSAGYSLCFLNLSSEREKAKCKHTELVAFPAFSHPSPCSSEWVYLDCISACTIILNNIKALALQSHFNTTFCWVSSNHLVIQYKDTTPNNNSKCNSLHGVDTKS